jgi:hypothetical protein
MGCIITSMRTDQSDYPVKRIYWSQPNLLILDYNFAAVIMDTTCQCQNLLQQCSMSHGNNPSPGMHTATHSCLQIPAWMMKHDTNSHTYNKDSCLRHVYIWVSDGLPSAVDHLKQMVKNLDMLMERGHAFLILLMAPRHGSKQRTDFVYSSISSFDYMHQAQFWKSCISVNSKPKVHQHAGLPHVLACCISK